MQLDEYQKQGVDFLRNTRRAILADYVGLGKTIQAIMAAEPPVLVVTKKSLIPHWEKEITQAGVGGEWLVVNYEQLGKITQPSGYQTLIVDEAHACKGRKNQRGPMQLRAKRVRALARVIPRVYMLTATPVMNHPAEVWALLNMLYPKEYSSFWRFVQKHCHIYNNRFGHVVGAVKDEAALQRELEPIILRRDKALLDLPSLSSETIWVGMYAEQQRLYHQMKKMFLAVIDEERSLVAPTVLAQLTRLRQICCSPALLGVAQPSAKTAVLLDLLDSYAEAGHKVLVFSTFAEYMRLLAKHLDAPIITGAQGQKERQEAIRQFEEGKPYLFGSVGAMGEGLNLQAADVVIRTDLHWTPSINEQAVGRAHRRGQEKPVHVVDLVCADSVEEHVLEVLRMKEELCGPLGRLGEVIRRERSDQYEPGQIRGCTN